MKENNQNLSTTPEAIRGSTPNDTVEHEKKKFLNKKWMVLGIIVLVLILISAGAVYFFLNSNKQVACTQEAKLCPDGSYVSRTGPKCEFAKCPEVTPTRATTDTSSWKTYRNEEYGFEFKFPEEWGNTKTDFVDLAKDELDLTAGKSLTIRFTKNPDIQVGSYSLDFAVPRGGAWWDELRNGYQERDGKYYYPSGDLKTYDPDLLIKNPIIFSANNITGIKTVVSKGDYEVGDIPFCEYWFTAAFNTKNKQFPGISFSECLNNTSINFEEVLNEFDSVISTFKFTK